MSLTPHFSRAEFEASDTARRRSINNTLPDELLPSATATCELLERIRKHLSAVAGRDIPITVTSGYRCPALNAAVGGSANSDHTRAQAADFKAPAFGTPYEVCRALAPVVGALDIGQLIHEFGTWVHVSTRRPDKLVNRIITISARGTEVGVQEVA